MTLFRSSVILLLGLMSISGPKSTAGQARTADDRWKELEPGLELGLFNSPQPSAVGDSVVRALRIDPQRFEFRLLNASSRDEGKPLTAREWSRQYDLVAAINPSMYQQDFRTSVSLMRTRSHINNPRLSKDMVVLAFDRKSDQVPLVKLIDRECDEFEVRSEKYHTLIQSIRMISCKGRNVWRQQPRKWSTAAIGTDRRGNVLFLHVRSPYTTHDLINILKTLPLSLERAMYAEGGPEAQLYIHSGEREFEFIGSFETGFNENDSSRRARPVPNVVGIARREPAAESTPPAEGGR